MRGFTSLRPLVRAGLFVSPLAPSGVRGKRKIVIGVKSGSFLPIMIITRTVDWRASAMLDVPALVMKEDNVMSKHKDRSMMDHMMTAAAIEALATGQIGPRDLAVGMLIVVAVAAGMATFISGGKVWPGLWHLVTPWF
jgi:hypothetical protein